MFSFYSLLSRQSFSSTTKDTALNMLGPDIELLTEILLELGQKHVRYGVRSEMFPVMGDALIHTLSECLGDDFTDEIREAWKDIRGDI